jgi:asparagine synthase (glutamine-hydrolysing)
MSAIAGIYHLNGEPISPEHSAGLMKVLEQFPANDIQTYQKENIFLGCHAQWITPESIGEKLPYYDRERKLAITADAIIDNRKELFEKLEVKKSKQSTMSDSELILLSYVWWGEECPKYLIGDFAFMIWDDKKQKLFGARDFSGARTLYYFMDSKRFSFCTTIKPMLTLPYVDNKLNEQWFAEFLAIPGMNDSVDTFITVYKNIQQVPPSHSICVEDGKVKLLRYCTISTNEKLLLNSNSEYEEAFREVFQQAVSSRLRTHHNVGAHLSGGLDSGSVVSIAAKSLLKENKRLHTFSYIPAKNFTDWTPNNVIADESSYIKSTVQYVGNIKDYYLDFAGTNPLSEITDWHEIMEMPYKFFANSIWIKGIFKKAHEEGIGVLLNGGRGNLSISWGPALSYYAILLKKLKWIHLYSELNQYSRNLGGNRLRMLPVIGKIAFPFVNHFSTSGETHHYPTLINKELAKRTNVFEKLKDHGIDVSSAYEKNIYAARRNHFKELYTWNATNTLGTKLSLLYSLQKRDPTNDLRVIRFCLSVPEDQFVQKGMDRALIRRATVNLLPEKVRLNQRIRGIQGADCVHRMAPFWEEFIEELEQLVSDPVISELINTPVVKAAIIKIKQGPKSELAFDPEYQILMNSLNVYRFIRKNTN